MSETRASHILVYMEKKFDEFPDFTAAPETGPGLHVLERAEKDDKDFKTAVKFYDILDEAIERFRPSGNVAEDAQSLRAELESAGVNFSRLGNRGQVKTKEFLGRAINLTLLELERAEKDYRVDTLNALEKLSEDLMSESKKLLTLETERPPMPYRQAA